MGLYGHSLIAKRGELQRAEHLIAFCALVFVTAIAAELPELLDDLFALRAPVLSYVIPPFAVFYAPILLLVMWFNGIAKGAGRFTVVIDPGLISAALLIFVLITIEFVHAFGSSVPEFEIIMEIAWFLLILLTLRSFSYLEGWSEKMLVTAAICCSIISIASITIPLNSLVYLGVKDFLFGPLRPQWDGVNSHSYFSAAIALVALHRLLFLKLSQRLQIFWVATTVINLVAIVANKSRGAWIAALLSIIFLAVAKLTGWSNRKVIVTTGLLTAITVGALLLVQSPALDRFVSLGRGLTPDQEFAAVSNLNADGTDRSSFAVRLGMIRSTAGTFLQSPLFGHGWSAISEMQFSGHSLHGVPHVIASSYGIIGLLLLAGFVYFNIPNYFRENASRLGPPLLLIVLVSVIARPSIPLWFAIIFVTLTTSLDDRQRATT